MENTQEYHDPDYPGTSSGQKDRTLTEAERLLKIKAVIRREFANELNVREDEVKLIDQRLGKSRHLLHRLRYTVVSRYYQQRALELPPAQHDAARLPEPRAAQEAAALLRAGQRRLHPSVKRLLSGAGAEPESGRRRAARRDYSAMVQCKNYTISADNTKTLRPESDRPQDEGRMPPKDVAQHAESQMLPKKVPRHIEPKLDNVLTLDSATRNKQKHRYRIIIGNTSKYAPAASPADRSTHKWLLYVRGRPQGAAGAGAEAAGAGASGAGAAGAEGLAAIVKGVRVQLHHSYAPHHTVFLDKPPYHVSRRGWGEFAARVELHFARPAVNRPAAVTHTVRLDRRRTGLQTLGAETVVDVWLYSDEEMLKYEYKEDAAAEVKAETATGATCTTGTTGATGTEVATVPQIKPEPEDHADQLEKLDDWLDFFNKDTTDLDVDEMLIKNIIKKEALIDKDPELDSIIAESSMELADGIKPEPPEDMPSELKRELLKPTSPRKRIMKYMEPNTGKIYYLEMDRTLDLTKVQEIVINSKGNRKTAKISPMKSNGVARRPSKAVSLLRADEKQADSTCLRHIQNDHCYLGVPGERTERVDGASVSDSGLYERLCGDIDRFACVRTAVNYLLGKIPLYSPQADGDFVRRFPFVVRGSEESFWRLDLAKRRNIEWSRAKLINKMLTERMPTAKQIWRTKQILLFSKLHGYQPIPPDLAERTLADDMAWRTDTTDTHTNEHTTLSIFDINRYTENTESADLNASEPDIDVVNDSPVKVTPEVGGEAPELEVLPAGEEDRLRFLFVERKCAEIGIELKNEDVGSGYAYSAAHAALLAATRSFASELLRGALAAAASSAGARRSVWTASARPAVSARALLRAARCGRLRLLSARGLGAPPH